MAGRFRSAGDDEKAASLAQETAPKWFQEFVGAKVNEVWGKDSDFWKTENSSLPAFTDGIYGVMKGKGGLANGFRITINDEETTGNLLHFLRNMVGSLDGREWVKLYPIKKTNDIAIYLNLNENMTRKALDGLLSNLEKQYPDEAAQKPPAQTLRTVPTPLPQEKKIQDEQERVRLSRDEVTIIKKKGKENVPPQPSHSMQKPKAQPEAENYGAYKSIPDASGLPHCFSLYPPSFLKYGFEYRPAVTHYDNLERVYAAHGRQEGMVEATLNLLQRYNRKFKVEKLTPAELEALYQVAKQITGWSGAMGSTFQVGAGATASGELPIEKRLGNVVFSEKFGPFSEEFLKAMEGKKPPLGLQGKERERLASLLLSTFGKEFGLTRQDAEKILEYETKYYFNVMLSAKQRFENLQSAIAQLDGKEGVENLVSMLKNIDMQKTKHDAFYGLRSAALFLGVVPSLAPASGAEGWLRYQQQTSQWLENFQSVCKQNGTKTFDEWKARGWLVEASDPAQPGVKYALPSDDSKKIDEIARAITNRRKQTADKLGDDIDQSFSIFRKSYLGLSVRAAVQNEVSDLTPDSGPLGVSFAYHPFLSAYERMDEKLKSSLITEASLPELEVFRVIKDDASGVESLAKVDPSNYASRDAAGHRNRCGKPKCLFTLRPKRGTEFEGTLEFRTAMRVKLLGGQEKTVTNAVRATFKEAAAGEEMPFVINPQALQTSSAWGAGNNIYRVYPETANVDGKVIYPVETVWGLPIEHATSPLKDPYVSIDGKLQNDLIIPYGKRMVWSAFEYSRSGEKEHLYLVSAKPMDTLKDMPEDSHCKELEIRPDRSVWFGNVKLGLISPKDSIVEGENGWKFDLDLFDSNVRSPASKNIYLNELRELSSLRVVCKDENGMFRLSEDLDLTGGKVVPVETLDVGITHKIAKGMLPSGFTPSYRIYGHVVEWDPDWKEDAELHRSVFSQLGGAGQQLEGAEKKR